LGFWVYLATSNAKSDVIFLLGDPDFLLRRRNFARISRSFGDLTRDIQTTDRQTDRSDRQTVDDRRGDRNRRLFHTKCESLIIQSKSAILIACTPCSCNWISSLSTKLGLFLHLPLNIGILVINVR